MRPRPAREPVGVAQQFLVSTQRSWWQSFEAIPQEPLQNVAAALLGPIPFIAAAANGDGSHPI